jgi:diguanylate cyclase (GGDEF)-like protein/PAS domain S-box-containing protein
MMARPFGRDPGTRPNNPVGWVRAGADADIGPPGSSSSGGSGPSVYLMVHRVAPPRLTAAFGLMLIAAGVVTLTRGTLIGGTVPVAAGAIAALSLGTAVYAKRAQLSFGQVGWIAVACTVLVAGVTASRDTPEGSGFALAWAAPFAYAAGRRVGIAHTLAAGVTLAAAFALQAARVDDPVAFGTYVSSWVAAVATAAIVGAVAGVILDSLERTQRQLDAGFEHGLLGQTFIDLAGRWTQVNGAFAAMVGRTPEELAGRTVTAITHPDDRGISLDNLAGVTADRLGTMVFDKRFVRPDGSICWARVHAVVLRDADGAPTGFFAEYTDITAQREAEERLQASDRRFERMFQDAGVGMVVISSDGLVEQANAAVGEILGTTPDALIGTDIRRWRHPDDEEVGEQARLALHRGERDTYRRIGRYVRSDGREIGVDITSAVVRGSDGEVDYALLQIIDVSDRDAAQRRESALAELGRLALGSHPAELLGAAVRVVAQTLGVPFATVVDADSGEVLAAHGWDGEAATGHALAALDGVGPLELHDPETELRFPTRALQDAGAAAGVAVAVAGEGDAPFAVLTVHTAVATRCFDHGELAFLASAGNVLTAAVRRDAAERELRHRALHDPVTRLPNRALLVDRLRHALVRARREHRSVAALFIDVDDFKDVNDRHGHEGGDELLRILGPRLQDALRANDTLARFGADEFVVVCEDLDDPEEALAVADRLLEAASAPCTLAGHTVRQTASIGIALSHGVDEVDAEGLLRDADLAMHRAKLAGKARYEVFAHAMRELALDRVALLNDLDRAIAQDELALVFQPIVRLTDGALHAAEALVRWHHPERGTIMPDEFIGLAERTGRIAELGRWVLREAAREAARWPTLIVGVNASRLQLSEPGFVDDVERVLGEHGIAPGRFTIEVTETALMEDPAAAETTLQALRDLGVRIALDDFGTGYSSLSSVSDFPLSTLKLDRAFLADHRPESQRWSIVRAVLDMARTLDLDVVVEGVETHAQRIALSELGAIHGQGFLFSRPVPADELTAMYAAAVPG